MKEFKVTDLLPRRSEFYLSIPDKTFSLRPCTPHDLINLKEKNIDIEEVMKNPISADVCKVVLYLMDYEDAKEFKKIELKTINIETGEEEANDVGGHKLLVKFIASLKEHLEMFLALLSFLQMEFLFEIQYFVQTQPPMRFYNLYKQISAHVFNRFCYCKSQSLK